MPKKIRDSLKREIKQDIFENYAKGERYRSISELAALWNASRQTVHNAIRELTEEGILTVKARSGAFVRERPERISLEGKTILLLSRFSDPRFNDAFFEGVTRESRREGCRVELIVDDKQPDGVDHAERIYALQQSMNASGIIALSFHNTPLFFLHLLGKGCVIVSDLIDSRLPNLPTLSTDNRVHSEYAAERFAAKGKKEVLITAYWQESNKRELFFRDRFLELVPSGKTQYLSLSDQLSHADLYRFFNNITPEKAVFALDYAANHTLAPYIINYKLDPADYFMVYDSEDESFLYPGLDSVPRAAPSLKEIGAALARKLLERLATGVWAEPIQEKI